LGTMASGTHLLAAPSLVGGSVLLFPMGPDAVLTSNTGRYPLPPYRISVVPASLVGSASLSVPLGGSVLHVGVR
jgi:hypothetical protein